MQFDQENVELFFYWINERHNIYLKRLAGQPAPWTDDDIMRAYKFTNPFRENDRVTIWKRRHWTQPNNNKPWGLQIFNTCLFRMFGTPEYAEAVGWQEEWNPGHLKRVARERLDNKQKVFTGAYIVTNQGLTAPKEEVVVDHFLAPIWEAKEDLADLAHGDPYLQVFHNELSKYRGWGGGGFMAYEVVTDLNHMPVLSLAFDAFRWANAGPGAKRGLNRLSNRPLNASGINWNDEMRDLLDEYAPQHLGAHIPMNEVDMRCIEHSLCEWDKWMRVHQDQGRPRSKVNYMWGLSWPVEEGTVNRGEGAWEYNG